MSNNRQFKVTLTEHEYQVIKRFADLHKKPIASVFANYLRETHLFDVIEVCCDHAEKMESLKNEAQLKFEFFADQRIKDLINKI